MTGNRKSGGRIAANPPRWMPQPRQLFTLTDQGAARALDLNDFGIRARDNSWNAYAQNFIAANRPQLSAIAVEPELVAGRTSIDLVLRPRGVVGAVPLLSPVTRKVSGGIVVRPRFGWDGIGPLLARVGWSAQPQLLEFPLVPGSAREVPPWVLAGPILKRFGALLSELRRGFHMQEAVRQTPRGQILWPSYLSTQAVRGAFHQIPCRFPDLGPDAALRGYLRWGIEAIQRSLAPYLVTDVIARRMAQGAEQLLFDLQDSPARPPDRRSLDLLLIGTGLPSEVLSRGVEALRWIVDERGLAGRAEADGLAWALPMHELFERWVEHFVRIWARGFGGDVRSGRANQTAVPVRWSEATHGSVTTLVPDLVVAQSDRVYVIDAKYKGHFQELDETRWMALAEELRNEHRHDVHQVLAYAGLFDADEVAAVLVYPMQERTWWRLAAYGKTVAQATLAGGGRSVNLVLAGIPMTLSAEHDLDAMLRAWESLRFP